MSPVTSARACGPRRQRRALIALSLAAATLFRSAATIARRTLRRQPREPADGGTRPPPRPMPVAATRPPPPRTVRGGSRAIEQLVEQQSNKPAKRFTPCNLVTAPQARAIVGAPIEQPFEAPQGPTCIYRSRDGEELRHGRRAVARHRHGSSRSSGSAGASTSSDRTGLLRPLRPGHALRAAVADGERAQRRGALRRRQAVRGEGRTAPRRLTPAAVYQVSSSDRAAARPPAPRRRVERSGARVNRTVVLLGLTSLLTDISSEMVVTVLPLYLRVRRRLLAARLRAHRRHLQRRDGARRAGERVHRRPLAAPQGGRRDRLRHLRAVQAAPGDRRYGRLRDRRDRAARPRGQGHPHRAARRDDLAVDAAEPQLGAAFGVHRAMDTTGAMLGPLVAFGMLALAPLAFDSIFLVSFCLALVGVGILVLLVAAASAGRPSSAAPRPAPPLRGAFGLLRIAALPRAADRRRRLSLATASDAFIFLAPPATSSTSAPRCSRCCSSAARARTCCWPCRWGGSPTGSGAAVCCSAATRCCSPSTPRCCSRSAAGCCSSRHSGFSARTTPRPTAC